MMTARAVLALVIVVAAGGVAQAAELTAEQAVAVALQRNRDVIAARLEIEASELDAVAARIYPNPNFEYALGNLVLGSPNPQNGALPAPSPGFFGQTVQTFGVSEIIDVWMKRSARIKAAERGIEHRRLLAEDALREIVYTVRSGFAETVREQEERQLAHDVADRYAQTIKISQSRFKAGDISEAELRKIELEGLRYQNDVIQADTELDVARGRLAALLNLASAAELPALRPGPSEAASRPSFDLPRLTARALERRPDLRAAGAARVQADALVASAERDALPDITLGAAYTHSDFTVSGDNPNALALTLSLPLPLFDRNQANIGRARLDQRRADNDGERLRIAVARDVAEAVRKGTRATTMLAVYERPAGGDVPGTPTGTSDKGGMISRAETALRVAEKSYRAGAMSLIELLEAQRTYLDTQAQYLRALYDFRQATVDVSHAVGEP
jgi:cobalt-zinc-cadmium efflux system outer membrane protein